MKKKIITFLICTLLITTITTTFGSSQKRPMLSIVDQQQPNTSEIHWLVGGVPNWQEFKNKGNMLEKVDLHVGCGFQGSYPITLSIEENIGGTPLTQVIYPPNTLPPNTPAWFTFDVPDVKLQANKKYYMVLRFDPGSEYVWSGAHGDPYSLGSSSHPDADWDYAFRTIVDRSSIKEIDNPLGYFFVNHPEITGDEILFSDDFNDNIKDYNKWTETYTNGVWEETNGRAEFQLTESGGTGARSEGIGSTAIQAMIGGDEPWENKVQMTWTMYQTIDATSSEGTVTMRISEGQNNIKVEYDRTSGIARYSDTFGNSGEFIGGDEPWENKLEIMGDKYIVTMNSQSTTIDTAVFATGIVTLQIQLFIELAGSTRTYFLRSGFDEILVKQITTENQPPSIPTLDGPNSGKINTIYDFMVDSTDPEGAALSYVIEWGDGTKDTATGESGEVIIVQHLWSSQGNYNIKAKAIDIYGAESGWATLPVTMPYSYAPILQCFKRVFERFPHTSSLSRYQEIINTIRRTDNASFDEYIANSVTNKFCNITGVGMIGFGWPLIPITGIFTPIGMLFGLGQISAYNGTNEPWTVKGEIGFIVVGFTGLWLNTLVFWMVVGEALYITAGQL